MCSESSVEGGTDRRIKVWIGPGQKPETLSEKIAEAKGLEVWLK
jgi:hypothetical protein